MQGTVHLKGMPRITQTCKALELDYAVAMVGFETRGGMSVPCFDGIVVCDEHAELITDAYHTAERYRPLHETDTFSRVLWRRDTEGLQCSYGGGMLHARAIRLHKVHTCFKIGARVRMS